MPHLIIPLLAAGAMVLSTAAADILHVPGDFPTIQAAIDAAVDGDEVEVHPGTYNETIDFLGKAIRVYSTDGPEVTIIDAQQTGSVVTCDSAEGPDSVLEGFTITGGNAGDGGGMHNIKSSPTVTNCTFSGNTATNDGGGMDNYFSSPTVTNCTFSGNTANGGGGMYNYLSSPTVTNCTFSGNTATYGGGGIFNFSSSPTVTNCTFSENSAATGGGMLNGHGNPTVIDCTFSGNSAAGGGGGGMHNERTSPTVIGCTFSGNSAFFGGGMSNRYNGSPTLTDCTFTGNTAGWAGGGMVNLTGSPTVTNCTFIGNSADDGGGMFNADGSSPTVTNCTFSGNSAPSGANLFATDQFGGHSMPTVNNSVIHGSGAGSITDVAGALTVVNYSDVQGGWPGIGNIDADPLFVDPDNDDFRLSSGSPCIDAGNNSGVPIDENDYDEDGVLCELFPVDLDGNPRFNADEADFDPGCGVPVVVDMGAFEYQFDPVDQVTFADLNGDGFVGVKDLLILLGSWGLCGKGCCLADLDINGNVGVTDLLALLGKWGPCP